MSARASGSTASRATSQNVSVLRRRCRDPHGVRHDASSRCVLTPACARALSRAHSSIEISRARVSQSGDFDGLARRADATSARTLAPVKKSYRVARDHISQPALRDSSASRAALPRRLRNGVTRRDLSSCIVATFRNKPAWAHLVLAGTWPGLGTLLYVYLCACTRDRRALTSARPSLVSQSTSYAKPARPRSSDARSPWPRTHSTSRGFKGQPTRTCCCSAPRSFFSCKPASRCSAPAASARRTS